MDVRTSTMNQAGEFLTAVKEGAVDASHIQGEIGDVLLGKLPGRGSDEEITIYKSLGVAAQDLAAAWHVLHESEAADCGQVVTL